MTESAENLILEHLKRFQSGQDGIERELKELKARMINLESGQASVIGHLAHLASTHASQQVAMDHMSERLDRLERRLELTHN